jgi:hypothetical protein
MRVRNNTHTVKAALTLLSASWLTSLLCAIAFFVLYLFVFRPGYQVDDDITMIQLASGYLGGTPVPFMVFSNVILGFILNLVYSLPTNLNWEILLFFGINFLSVWCLVHIVLSLPLKSVYQFFGILVVLLSDSLFLLNVTFTTMATFSVISGFVSILAATYKRAPFPRRMLLFGGLLILAGSLIRIESFLLVLLLVFPSMIFMVRYFHLKNLLISFTTIILVVALFYLFNTIDVKSFPQWDYFYAYNNVRSELQDTPRVHLANVKNAYYNIGWNFNDYKLFMNWFFPDEQLFSISNLQYLVLHIPGTEKNVFSAALSYFYPKPFFDDVDSFPYFLMFAAGLLSLAINPSLRKAIWPLVVLLLTFLVLIFYLIWTEKVPLRVWDSFLATTTVFSLFILLWIKLDVYRSEPQGRNPFAFMVPVLLCAASLFALYYAASTTQLNVQRQAAYQDVLSNLRTLQAQGKIQNNALIVSPAVGVPLVWSNPMFLDLPSAQYIEMGWLTFSPSYYSVLHEFNIQSLPAGFYQKDNVYLMVKANLIDSMIEYIFDHAGVVVVPQLIYSAPNHDFDPAYNNVKLYKLILQK